MASELLDLTYRIDVTDLLTQVRGWFSLVRPWLSNPSVIFCLTSCSALRVFDA